MSDMTIVQLMAAQREREFRSQHTPGGIGDRFAAFLAAVFVVCIAVLFLATRAAILVLGPVCGFVMSRPAKRCPGATIVDL